MLRSSLALLLLLGAAKVAAAQAATGILELAVTDAAGAPVAGARVALEGIDGRAAEADREGRVVLVHLHPGSHALHVSAPASCPRTVAVDVLPHDRRRATISLEPTPCAAEKDVAPAAPAAPAAPPASRTTLLRTDEAGALPRPANAWALLRDAPGVVLDRVDVGGSGTAQSSLLVTAGDGGAGAAWSLDGVEVTDPAALGFPGFFPDVASASTIEVRIGAADVRVRTPGVHVGLALREPGERFGGRARLAGSAGALQSQNLRRDEERPPRRARTGHVLEAAAEAGGPLRPERLWLWGAAAWNELGQRALSGHDETLRTTSVAAKARARLGAGDATLLALRAEKTHDHRDPAPAAAPEARWGQSGPAHLLALEDRRSLGRVSLLSHASYLDAGFRLDPRGGTGASALEDLGGVWQRSYQAFESDRRRLRAGAEAMLRADAFGLSHTLLAGASLRRQPVETRVAWPGNKVVALERQSVFFRTFRLTGFALPTRDMAARSAVEHWDAYVEDSARAGRFAFRLGARLDRVTGRNLESAVGANPVVPELLPAVAYPGGAERIRWLDLLPRASVAWDAAGDGRAVVEARYAAYGAALGAGEVVFDNPIGREPASLTFYWIDRNGDRVVQAGELDRLRGVVGSSGLDPEDPGSTLSPHVVAGGLRSPRTHELSLGVAGAWGRSLDARLSLTLRRNHDTLWRPLRNLTLADYQATGAVTGSLFGREYAVTYFAPATTTAIVPGNGRLLANREGYRRDAAAVELVLAGRWGGRLRWQAFGSVSDWWERFADRELAVQDPTPTDAEPLADRGRFAVRPGGLGRGDVFVQARWTAGASAVATLPWRLEAGLLLHARDGFPIPYVEVASTGDVAGGAKSVLVAERIDQYRLPPVVLADLRLSRRFGLGRGRLGAFLDAYNALNAGTALQVARDVELPFFDRPREAVRPRILSFGVDFAF